VQAAEPAALHGGETDRRYRAQRRRHPEGRPRPLARTQHREHRRHRRQHSDDDDAVARRRRSERERGEHGEADDHAAPDDREPRPLRASGQALLGDPQCDCRERRRDDGPAAGHEQR
jgi:hypothetical protein